MSILKIFLIACAIFYIGLFVGWAFRGLFEHTWGKKDERELKISEDEYLANQNGEDKFLTNQNE